MQDATRRPRRALMAVAAVVAAIAWATPVAGAAGIRDSVGDEFWLMFNDNLGTPALTLFIAGDAATTGTVEIPGLSFSQAFSVTPGTVTSVVLPAGAEATAADGVEQKAVHVTAGGDVAVYGLNRITATTDAFNGLPVDAVGTEYLVMSYPGANSSLRSELGVVATQDGTTVTITPSAPVEAHPAGTPYTVTLDRGETYQGKSTGDLTGTLVAADKPVSVFGASECSFIPTTAFACDHLTEQLYPTDAWGEAFVAMPLATRTKGDTFRFLAAQDGTVVTVDGAAQPALDRGEFQEFRTDAVAPLQVTADKPILVAQYSNGTQHDNVTSDPFMMLVPPFEQFLTGYTITTPASGFAANFVNVVVPTSAVGSVLLDGTAIPAGEYTPIGDSGLSGTQQDIALGAHTLSGDVPFGAFVYGFDNADSYGYPAGGALAPVASVTNLTFEQTAITAAPGTEVCLVAVVTDDGGAGLADVRVDFALDGVNEVAPASVTTDAAGKAPFCYTGTVEGTDSLTATVGGLSDTATVLWSSLPPPPPNAPGYTMVSADGGFFAFGEHGFVQAVSVDVGPVASPSGRLLQAALVGGATTPSELGYWGAAGDGGVFAFGDAGFFGSAADLPLAAPVVGMAATPTGLGYWLAGADGGVLSFGDASFFGSAAGLPLIGDIVSIVPTPTGLGYWLVGADGGVFAFGDAEFLGSTGGVLLAAPVVDAVTTESGAGYWLAAADGGVFAFGDAPFTGSLVGTTLRAPVTALSATVGGAGYTLVAGDGGAFALGDAEFFGSAARLDLREPIVDVFGP